MADTSIEWATKVWNVTRGCTPESEGCRNCYAKYTALRFSGPGQPYEGLVQKRLRVISDDEQYLEPMWTGDVRFVPEKLTEPLRWAKPQRIFVNSMSDLFHKGFTNEQIAAVLGIAAAAPQHTFMILTKQAARMRAWFEWIAEKSPPPVTAEFDRRPTTCWSIAKGFIRETGAAIETSTWNDDFAHRAHLIQWPLPNVWLGVSVESQDHYDRISDLVATPSEVRFVSAEPLLGPLNLGLIGTMPSSVTGVAYRSVADYLHWVIAGAESGRRARTCDVAWLRALRDECDHAGTPFFLKQANQLIELVTHPNGGSYPHAAICAGDGGGSKAGALIKLPYLDGRKWIQFPEGQCSRSR